MNFTKCIALKATNIRRLLDINAPAFHADINAPFHKLNAAIIASLHGGQITCYRSADDSKQTLIFFVFLFHGGKPHLIYGNRPEPL